MQNKNINVEIRIKPSLESSLEVNSNSLQVGTKKYFFNKVHITTTQKQIFEGSVVPLLEKFLKGENCTILAYGQTGSGKTYTMGIEDDTLNNLDLIDSCSKGIVPRSLEYLFNKDCKISCSFIEIYNEEVIDLLSSHKIPLSLRESKGDVIIAGVTEKEVYNLEEVTNLLRQGCQERTTKSTNMNSQSSRSHAIFTLTNFNFNKNSSNEISNSKIVVTNNKNSPNVVTNMISYSKISFVDLAGSERLKRTLCTGVRAKESISINSGLLALGNVISSLYLKRSHIPYRDSKLTRILQSCLNTHILMIACISSISKDINETNNTLKYASRASSIEMNIKKNIEVDTSKYEIIKLKKEIQRLSTENQILRERMKKIKSEDVEELIKENRRMKNEIERKKEEGKSEDIAQMIIKHPFVQNLINENERLQKNQDKIKRDGDKINMDKMNGDGDKMNGDKVNGDGDTTNGDKVNDENKIYIYTDENKINTDKNTDYNKINTNKDINTDINTIENKLSWKRIKHVTFDISPPKKKSSLWTPRKERVLMDTVVKDKILGYIPHSMIIYNDHLIFSSYDNLLRVRSPSGEISTLCSDAGIKCLCSDESILYSTRMILKTVDFRTKGMPLYAYRNEISCIMKRGHLIYTGHEDGSLSVLDIRNMSIKSEKIHSGTIFCIEEQNNKIYTCSRDHTIKMIDTTNNNQCKQNYSSNNNNQCNQSYVKSSNIYGNTSSTNNTNTCTNVSSAYLLNPPHFDVVHSLIKYKGDLLSLSRDCSLKRWREGEIVKTVPNAHSSWIKCGVALSDSFVTGSKNGTLRYWDYCEDSVFCVGSFKTGPVNCMVRYKEGAYVGAQNKEITYLISTYK
ncbi:kinesin-like protein KIF21B [Vairimorpha necatrix]|uniref:Kinesin-like protein n=1 Tax=Vairimorpha necatrix TaxID=6039 RepID=A0AAX4JF71_9MICR